MAEDVNPTRDLEKDLEVNKKRKKGLITLRRTIKKDEPFHESLKQVDKFTHLGKLDKTMQESVRTDWEKHLFEEIGRCSTGANPSLGKRKYERPIIVDFKRVVPAPTPAVQPAAGLAGYTNEELIALILKLQQELAGARAEIRKLKSGE